MRFLLVSFACFSLLFQTSFCCEKFDKFVNLYCKMSGETTPCLHSDGLSYKAECCAKPGGCTSRDFPVKKVCCFTQECLDRCYPGKGHKVGSVY